MKQLLLVILMFLTSLVFGQAIDEQAAVDGNQSVTIEDEYFLQRGDEIKIEVMEHPEFSKNVRVLPDGSIEYPILGKLQIEGMSLSILKSVIKDNLKSYIPIPIVTIYVTNIYGEKINIIGYVNKPGSYQIYNSIDIVDAIALAGGITNIRKVKFIKIIRKDGSVLNVRLSRIWFSKNARYSTEGRILLSAGDSLIIPPPIQFNWSIISAIASLVTVGISIYTLTQ